MNRELVDIIKDFSKNLDDEVERILEINQDVASCIGTVLGAYICKMVIDRYGKTGEAQEILNVTMKNAWEAINEHDKV